MNRGGEVLNAVAGWDADRIQRARVLVVGAGALGNEVLKNLALLGVGQILLVDFDHVEPHNLSRSVLYRLADADAGLPKVAAAARTLIDLNPALSVLTLQGDVMAALGAGLVSKMDVAIGCLDNRLARLALNRLCWRAGIPWVDGGILQLGGHVCAYVPGQSCYECQLSAGEWADLRSRMGCADMARRYVQAGRMPTTPLSASVVGAVQVQEALRLLHSPTQARTGGQLWSWEGQTLASGLYERLPLKQDCLAHVELGEIVLAEGIGHDATWGTLLELVGRIGGEGPWRMRLPNGLLRKVAAPGAEEKAVLLPRLQFSDRVAQVLGDGAMAGIPRAGMVDWVGEEKALLGMELWRLGVGFGEVVELRCGERRLALVLGKDLEWLAKGPGWWQLPNPWAGMTPEAVAELGMNIL